MSTIQHDSFVTLHYRLAGPQGDIINTFNDKPATLSMGNSELSSALEQCLLGLADGAHQSFHLPVGQAFGPRNPDMVQWISTKLLNELSDPGQHHVVGDVIQFPTPDGLNTYAGTVIQAADDGALLCDFNHPLSGVPVEFEVKVIGVL